MDGNVEKVVKAWDSARTKVDKVRTTQQLEPANLITDY